MAAFGSDRVETHHDARVHIRTAIAMIDDADQHPASEIEEVDHE